jgi:hypothetical protein
MVTDEAEPEFQVVENCCQSPTVEVAVGVRTDVPLNSMSKVAGEPENQLVSHIE